MIYFWFILILTSITTYHADKLRAKLIPLIIIIEWALGSYMAIGVMMDYVNINGHSDGVKKKLFITHAPV